MIKLKRVIISGSLSYDNVNLFDDEDQMKAGILRYIDAEYLTQIVFKTNDGLIKIVPDWVIGIVEVKKINSNRNHKKMSMIVLNGEVSYGPIHIVMKDDYNHHNIPQIFSNQLAFVADGNLYVCRQGSIIEITQ